MKTNIFQKTKEKLLLFTENNFIFSKKMLKISYWFEEEKQWTILDSSQKIIWFALLLLWWVENCSWKKSISNRRALLFLNHHKKNLSMFWKNVTVFDKILCQLNRPQIQKNEFFFKEKTRIFLISDLLKKIMWKNFEKIKIIFFQNKPRRFVSGRPIWIASRLGSCETAAATMTPNSSSRGSSRHSTSFRLRVRPSAQAWCSSATPAWVSRPPSKRLWSLHRRDFAWWPPPPPSASVFASTASTSGLRWKQPPSTPTKPSPTATPMGSGRFKWGTWSPTRPSPSAKISFWRSSSGEESLESPSLFRESPSSTLLWVVLLGSFLRGFQVILFSIFSIYFFSTVVKKCILFFSISFINIIYGSKICVCKKLRFFVQSWTNFDPYNIFLKKMKKIANKILTSARKKRFFNLFSWKALWSCFHEGSEHFFSNFFIAFDHWSFIFNKIWTFHIIKFLNFCFVWIVLSFFVKKEFSRN